jgi:cell division FtsZ-interacting protein ZapD
VAKVDELLEEYRREALLRDKNLQADYVRRWRRIEDVTQDKIQALIYELNAAKDANNPIMDYQLHQLERYQSLLAQIQSEIFRFMRFADGNISGIQQAAAADGLDFGYQSLK